MHHSIAGLFVEDACTISRHPFSINTPFKTVLSSSMGLHLNGCSPMLRANATPSAGLIITREGQALTGCCSPLWLVFAQTRRLGSNAIRTVTQGMTTNQWLR